ncbi:SDR family oxidoreductase [Aliiglaciecola lipolytica]|uniref:Dehydrogenase/reductase SDR family member 4 n=1 Tax=Aliiglaciecola lipolytica E3 TaxID=1127673 RepID=K6X1Q5_9ALTE|nr:SDR family oxidoreductase [Aliiglaciecola lipolytica]GAC14589.1 dehydrogenase/reductase SDR family member 4 [Aliiglaciecola lipolytica E3]
MKKDLFNLHGKVALVTGASRGIGESIARLLAAYGAEVIVSSRKIDGCEAVASSIRESGGKAHAMACHVGDLTQIEATFKQIEEQFGELDILVNNAAANPFFGHILDTDLAAYEKTVDVNIRGYFFMSVAAGKMMKEQGGGVILNTASVNALSPGDMQGIYSISKAAVVSMTKAFAKECGGLNIRVNALLPGLTDTKFASALTTNEKILKQALKVIPLGRVADPDEMAGTVLYLVSDASSYTTGTTVVVDGGMMA